MTQSAGEQGLEIPFKRLPFGLNERLAAVGECDPQIWGVGVCLSLHLELHLERLMFDPDNAWRQEEDFDAQFFQHRFVLDWFALEPRLVNCTDAAMRAPSNYGPCWFHCPERQELSKPSEGWVDFLRGEEETGLGSGQ
jgi:hypothetical protein